MKIDEIVVLKDFEYKIKRQREAVLIICENMKGQLLLDFSLKNTIMNLSFFSDEILINESKLDAVKRILKERKIEYNNMKYIGNIFEDNGIYYETHIYVVNFISIYSSTNILISDIVEVSKYINSRIIKDELTIKAFKRYIDLLTNI